MSAISVFAHIRYKQAMDSEYSDSYVSKHSKKYTSAPSSLFTKIYYSAH